MKIIHTSSFYIQTETAIDPAEKLSLKFCNYKTSKTLVQGLDASVAAINLKRDIIISLVGTTLDFEDKKYTTTIKDVLFMKNTVAV